MNSPTFFQDALNSAGPRYELHGLLRLQRLLLCLLLLFLSTRHNILPQTGEVQEHPEGVHSMDWFSWENLNRKPWFLHVFTIL